MQEEAEERVDGWMDGNSYFINDGFGLWLGSSYLNVKYEYTVNKPIDEILYI